MEYTLTVKALGYQVVLQCIGPGSCALLLAVCGGVVGCEKKGRGKFFAFATYEATPSRANLDLCRRPKAGGLTLVRCIYAV